MRNRASIGQLTEPQVRESLECGKGSAYIDRDDDALRCCPPRRTDERDEIVLVEFLPTMKY